MCVDVLIPVASQSKFIREAVLSATQQAGSRNIYIIENNIGNVDYSNYLKALAAEFSIEYVFFAVRLPIFENWQRCLTVGGSEWVAFLHDDDIWPADYLQVLRKIENTTDIIFFNFKLFEGIALRQESRRAPVVMAIESREKSLAMMMCTDHHVSSIIFKRCLNLNFPVQYKMIGDQLAFRSLVGNNKVIKVACVSMDSPVLIRVHPNQETRTGSSLYAGLESAISYRIFSEIIGHEQISTERFCNELIDCSTDDRLCAIMSAILFRRPRVFSIIIAVKILLAKKSLRLFLATLTRLIAQDLVWSVRIILDKRRHSRK